MLTEVLKKDDYAILLIQEDQLNFTAGPGLRQSIAGLTEDGFANLILDLGEVRHADSSGLSGIVAADRICKNMGGQLVLARVNRQVQKIIALSRLDSVLCMKDSLEEAVSVVTP